MTFKPKQVVPAWLAAKPVAALTGGRHGRRASPIDTAGSNGSFARVASATWSVHVLGAITALALQLVLSRTLGVDHYGVYAYAIAWLNVLVLVGRVGLDTASLRFVAAYRARQEWGLLRGFLRRSTQLTLAISVAVGLTAAAIVGLLSVRIGRELTIALWIVCALLPVASLAQVVAAALTAMARPAVAAVPIRVGCPVLIVVLLGCMLAFDGRHLGSRAALALHATALLTACVVSVWLLRQTLPAELATRPREYADGAWGRVMVPLVTMSLLGQMRDHMDVLFVGTLLGTTEAGIYALAVRITKLILLGALSVKAIAAPQLSASYAHGSAHELQRTATVAAWGLLACCVPVAVVLIVAGRPMLALFGPEFAAAYVPMVILAAGQIVNAVTGLVAVLLAMTGNERYVARTLAAGCILATLLYFLLVPALGMVGAATVRALSIVAGNLLMLVFVVRVLGVNPTAIPAWGHRG